MISFCNRLLYRWHNSAFRRKFMSMYYNFFRRFARNERIAEVYLSLNDPYSFMLVQALPSLSKRYNIKFRLLLMYENSELNYASKLWRAWAIKDANILANCYQLTKIEQQPLAKSLITGQQLWLLHYKTIDDAIAIFKQTWFNQFDSHYAPSTPVMNFQIKNQQRQLKKGYFQPASIYFLGEWYQGFERLDHLEYCLSNLSDSDLDADLDPDVIFSKHQLRFENVEKIDSNEALTVYASIRSPYAYIGWLQAKRLSEHYNIPLVIKPVLPLTMRGIDVPLLKQKYIFFDALREARIKHLPVRKYFDPIGKGVINIYQLVPYIEQNNLSIAYFDLVFKAIYVDGIDLSQQKNIESLCQELSIDFEQALEYSKTHDWQFLTEQNQQELAELGFWGVPCFTYRDAACWGQDRLYQIEQEITRLKP